MRTQVINSKGFTLVELLTVIAIIGILAGFLTPALGRARLQSRLGKIRADLRTLADACDAYMAENGTYPPMGNDWVRIGTNGIRSMGGAQAEPGRFQDGNMVFFSSEDIGRDGIGPYYWDTDVPGQFEWRPRTTPNVARTSFPTGGVVYTGPDADGSEGNYRLDPGEDIGLDLIAGTNDATEGNGRLDGTFYARIGAIEGDVQSFGMADEFGADNTQLYHYYAGLKSGPPVVSTVSVHDALEQLQRSQPAYNACVIYGVGPDASDHGVHSLYTATMDNGEDHGSDGYRADPFDGNGNGVIFDRSPNESDNTQDTDPDEDGVFDPIGAVARVYDFDVRQDLAAQGPDANYRLPGDRPDGDGLMMVVRGL